MWNFIKSLLPGAKRRREEAQRLKDEEESRQLAEALRVDPKTQFEQRIQRTWGDRPSPPSRCRLGPAYRGTSAAPVPAPTYSPSPSPAPADDPMPVSSWIYAASPSPAPAMDWTPSPAPSCGSSSSSSSDSGSSSCDSSSSSSSWD